MSEFEFGEHVIATCGGSVIDGRVTGYDATTVTVIAADNIARPLERSRWRFDVTQRPTVGQPVPTPAQRLEWASRIAQRMGAAEAGE